MKLKNTIVALVIAGFTAANAATITVTNLSAGTFAAVADAGGNLLTSGIVTIGTYSSEPTGIDDVLDNYTPFAQSIGFFGAGAPGYFTGDINQNIPLGSSLVGQNVYVVIGNGASLGASDNFLVWKATANDAGNTYTADNPVGGPGTVTVLGDKGTPLVGDFGTVYDSPLGSQAGYTMAGVPEPSIALLGALGVLGLIRRRR